MHISKLVVKNYRNFSGTTLLFNKGVNTIIGENGSGKSNIFRAIRLMLDDNMLRTAYKVEEGDFHRGLGDWRGHWIIVSLEFDEIGLEESIQALFAHGVGIVNGAAVGRATYNLIFRPKRDIRVALSELDDGDFAGLELIRDRIEIANYETIFTGRSTVDFSDPEIYKEIVGDFESCEFNAAGDDPRIGAKLPGILSVSKEVSFTFIQALRDVVAEFHNNRTNPLLTLLKAKSGEIAPGVMAPIVEQVTRLNASIEDLDDVQTVRSNIRDTIKDAAGETYSPTSLSIKSGLPDEADRLFQSLKLFVGETEESYEGGIHELSLGGANLIYLTLKLLEFKYQKQHQSVANFLVIEEPEAHIHTHIQKTLFDRIAYSDAQIIYSTHSTQISEVSNIRNVNILGRRGLACEAYQPATGLNDQQAEHVQRYLDAIRCNLLFAKSVVLVEGDAEELLIPALFKKVMGISLDELGISLINVRSTGFENVALLFHDQRIRKHCSIITDLDEAVVDTTPNGGDSEKEADFKKKCLASQTAGERRKRSLDRFVAGNDWLSVHYAENTFEVDFISAGNARYYAELVPQIYSRAETVERITRALSSRDKAQYGPAILRMAESVGKGWLAIRTGQKITVIAELPKYIADAIFSARPILTREVIHNIYSYRVKCARDSLDLDGEGLDRANAILKRFRLGEVDAAAMHDVVQREIPDDDTLALLSEVI